MRAFGIIAAAIVVGMIYLAASLVFPQLLLFPHHAMVGQTPVYSSTPIPTEIQDTIARADARVRTSPIFDRKALRRPVFLTDGGVRWRILSIGVSSAFAQTRPAGENIVVNRSSVRGDRVWNGVPASERSLSGVIAHERTHVLIRGRFGLFADRVHPRWIVEGYCDHVAGESTLSAAEAARLRTEESRSQALFYHDSRKRVEQRLKQNGGSVDALFAGAGAR